MSDISQALVPDKDGFVRLSSVHFSAGMIAYLLGDLSAKKAADIFDLDRKRNGSGKLEARHKTNLSSIKVAYDAMTPARRVEFLLKMTYYPNLLQNGNVTQGWFDGHMGL